MAGSEQLENIEFFKGKRVLVTGHTGFKGAWLSAVLNFMGADASGYALEAQPGCLYEKICGDELIHSVTGDLLDSRLLEQTVREIQPEIIIHLAGFGGKQDCLEDPVRAFQTNLMGSTILLEALRECPSVKSIVLESVCRSFEYESGGLDDSEGEVLGGADPYSSSKICMEYMARDYREIYFQTDRRVAGVAVVRTGNILGGMVHGESADADVDVEYIGNTPAGNEHIQARGISAAPNIVVVDSDDGIHRLLLPKCRQSVLDVLDGYLSVSRMIYERPAIYSGEWEVESEKESRSGFSCEKEARQQEEFFNCCINGETVRGICMERISQYYGKACLNVCR